MTSRTTIKLTTTRIRREEDGKRKGPDKIWQRYDKRAEKEREREKETDDQVETRGRQWILDYAAPPLKDDREIK